MIKTLIKNFKLKIKNYNSHASNIFFYLILLLLPTQFGKHFWPEFSYIQGIRIDYLSPTLYFTDLLIIVLFLLWLSNLIKSKIKNQRSNIKANHSSLRAKRSNLLYVMKIATGYSPRNDDKSSFNIRNLKLVLLVVFLSIGIISSKSPFAGMYGLVKLFEFAFFGYYVSQKIRSIKDLISICLIFTIGILFESLLSIAQYLNQGSIGGFFYFLGERTFNSQTPGIANASLNGELVLRPYGTFSHPNVLAAYLLIGMTTVISNLKAQTSKLQLKSKIYEIFLGLSILSGTIALLLTMSRVAILIWLVFLFYLGSNYLLKILKFHYSKLLTFNFKLLTLILVLVFIGSIFTLSPIRYRFISFSLNEESLIARKDLMNTSFQMIKDNPVFGVGVNNFLVNIPYYQKFGSTSLFSYFQPVHNIYLLVLSELGAVGFLFFVWFIYRTILNLKTQSSKLKTTTKNSKLILLLILLALGLFDHYFLTLQQGQLLFAFVLGLCWSKIKIDEGKNKRDNRI